MTNNQSLYERLYGKTPNYNILRVFGSPCFVFLQPHERSKLKPHSRLYGSFLSYGIKHKGYHCWDPISKHFHIFQHVKFWEHKMFSSFFYFHLFENNSVFFTNSSVRLFPTYLCLMIAMPLFHPLLIFSM